MKVMPEPKKVAAGVVQALATALLIFLATWIADVPSKLQAAAAVGADFNEWREEHEKGPHDGVATLAAARALSREVSAEQVARAQLQQDGRFYKIETDLYFLRRDLNAMLEHSGVIPRSPEPRPPNATRSSRE